MGVQLQNTTHFHSSLSLSLTHTHTCTCTDGKVEQSGKRVETVLKTKEKKTRSEEQSIYDICRHTQAQAMHKHVYFAHNILLMKAHIVVYVHALNQTTS